MSAGTPTLRARLVRRASSAARAATPACPRGRRQVFSAALLFTHQLLLRFAVLTNAVTYSQVHDGKCYFWSYWMWPASKMMLAQIPV